MNAEAFWSSFKAMLTDDFLRQARKKWDNHKKFTNFILPHLSDILSDNGFEKEHQREYFKIDLIGWQQRKDELEESPRIGDYQLNRHFWHLGVAVEHENNSRDWTYELVKLLYINCPLRVVIGYLPKELNAAEQKQILDYAAAVVTKANADANGALVRKGQEYLLILGTAAAPSIYTPYLYKASGFEPLEGSLNATNI